MRDSLLELVIRIVVQCSALKEGGMGMLRRGASGVGGGGRVATETREHQRASSVNMELRDSPKSSHVIFHWCIHRTS